MSLEGRVIGLIEDDPIMGESLVQSLTLEGAYVDWWQSGSEAIRGLKATSPDLVVCDIRLPDTTGDRLFSEIAQTRSAPPFLFMTAFGDIDEAVRLMRAGAGDYVAKPFDLETFMDRARSLIRAWSQVRPEGTLGASEAMKRVEQMLRRVAPLTSPVLLTGETGVGKEVCARFLHGISPRADRPIIAVNCAALPTDLMESELFGHERGAFTGAHAQHKGYAERAGGGMLFLDEIAELPLPLQAKLLRLIEERAFTRVGGERKIPFKARLVCATNCDLNAAVRDGRFRLDLLHRINTVSIEIPALRQRPEDIPTLMELFFDQFSAELNSDVRGFASLTIDAALEHSWPGNVRELRNRVERALALSYGQWIMPTDLFPEQATGRDGETVAPLATLSEAREVAERRQIQRALRESAGRVTRAAELLGISRTTLWEKMRRLGIGSGDEEE
ncbi:MAG TPA: sigma-54 dependent transcriptional regulator [Hyphomicrobiaceae bacterium]